MPLSLEEVRERVLDEHRALREEIATIERLLDHAVGVSGHHAPDALARELVRFLDELARHMSLEDEILEPALRTVDAWGDVRAQMLRDDHAAQRTEMDHMRVMLLEAPVPPDEIRSRFVAFISHLRDDMAREERDTLSPELLKDDPIQPANISG